MPDVSALLRSASARLGSPAEARTLLAHASGLAPSHLLVRDEVDEAAATRLADLVARRVAGVPIQYLTGTAHFRTVSLRVGPGVFIPRPETEVMTGWALARVAEVAATGAVPRVVELCAGSGAISLAIATEHPGGDQYAVELSEAAAEFARTNLAGTMVALVVDDMADSLTELDGTVDVVIANPPYIPLEEYEGVAVDVREHEPTLALFSGPDGLDALRTVSRVAARLLRPGGVVAVEHADSQGESAPAVFTAHGGFARVRDHRDLTGRPRFVTAERAAVAGRMVP